MIIRNINSKEVIAETYIAHGGAFAQRVLDQRVLEEIGFFYTATLNPSKEIEVHTDPMEEIYFIMKGEGEMTVGDETRHVVPGDAIWLPAKVPHGLVNAGSQDLTIIAVASPNW